MRDLMECQAEVFRRSEQRIKVRKQRRNRMLMACVPVVLCLAFALATAPWEQTANSPMGENCTPNTNPPEDIYSGITDSVNPSLTASVTEIRLSEKENSLSLTNPEEISRIVELVGESQALNNQLTGAVPGGDKENGRGDDGTTEEKYHSASRGYTVTVVRQTGEETVYYLVGSTMKNLTENKTYTLSQAQMAAWSSVYEMLQQ
ncbi:MAG: hypothetical protein IKK11_01695 [Oscillospiraceae bacterium]|nr:hypothetical protein [Oscillospiraceae bacterium]